MSAELLRRAAKVLRDHADAAIGGKWLSLDAGDRLISVNPDDDHVYLVTEEPALDGPTADYIALMHPPVGLAVAKVLDRTAETFEDSQSQSPEAQIRLTEAYAEELDLARAILREAGHA